MDIETDWDGDAVKLGGEVELVGSIKHRPVQGGSTHIKSLLINPRNYARPADSPTAQLPESSAAQYEESSTRAQFGYDSRAPEWRCRCGHTAFLFTVTCPKCGHDRDATTRLSSRPRSGTRT